jgi:hypothetical protein
MPPRKRKWSRHVHTRQGKLNGWCSDCPAQKRRAALKGVLHREGYGTAVRRINFLRNVANRSDNRKMRHVATTDLNWLRRQRRE